MATSIKSLPGLFDGIIDDYTHIGVEKTPLEKLKQVKDRSQISELSLNSQSFSVKAVKVVLNTFQSFLSSLTLDGSWPDEELKCFSPYFCNITRLRLINITFTDAAFDEVFASNIMHACPFENTLDFYSEKVSTKKDIESDYLSEMSNSISELTKKFLSYKHDVYYQGVLRSMSDFNFKQIDDDDEWTSAEVVLPKRSYLPLELSPATSEELSWEELSSLPRKKIEIKKGMAGQDKILSTQNQSSDILCPLLKELTIENAPNLTKEFLFKLLVLKDQLNILTFKDCPSLPPREEIQALFPKTQINFS